MNEIENTQENYNPLFFLAETMCKGGSEAIEASEARGQKQLVVSDVLPVKWLHGLMSCLGQAGVVFGEVCADDPLFQEVTLPKGWSKKATDHAMWSKLLDDKGRERASIFYKAAFYGRGAHISPTTRFRVCAYSVEGKAVVYDGGNIIHEIAIRGDGDYNQKQVADISCREWLHDKHPKWEDPAEYWDLLTP